MTEHRGRHRSEETETIEERIRISKTRLRARQSFPQAERRERAVEIEEQERREGRRR